MLLFINHFSLLSFFLRFGSLGDEGMQGLLAVMQLAVFPLEHESFKSISMRVTLQVIFILGQSLMLNWEATF